MKKEKLSHHVTICLTDTDYNYLMELVHRHSLCVSTIIRWLIRKELLDNSINIMDTSVIEKSNKIT